MPQNWGARLGVLYELPGNFAPALQNRVGKNLLFDLQLPQVISIYPDLCDCGLTTPDGLGDTLKQKGNSHFALRVLRLPERAGFRVYMTGVASAAKKGEYQCWKAPQHVSLLFIAFI